MEESDSSFFEALISCEDSEGGTCYRFRDIEEDAEATCVLMLKLAALIDQ